MAMAWQLGDTAAMQFEMAFSICKCKIARHRDNYEKFYFAPKTFSFFFKKTNKTKLNLLISYT